MTGRVSDGSDSYSYILGVAACGSAISGEASCAAEGRGRREIVLRLGAACTGACASSPGPR
jgi:hypothetical protein